jgi:hydrogenase nickel incorporation protein HypA/HybF
MHERSVANNLLNIVLEKAKISGKQKKVESIRIVLGEFTMIHDELLVSAFYQLSKTTAAENAKIEIVHSPLRGKCQNCQREFDLNKESFKCPYCGSGSIQIISGDELFIQDIILTKD